MISGVTTHRGQSSMECDIKSLPPEHPARNTPLGLLKAEYKIGSTWRPVLPSFGIAKSTFNQLGEVWTQHQWRVNQGAEMEERKSGRC